MTFELTQILGEQTPDRLEEEVAAHVGRRRETVAKPVVEPGHQIDGLASHRLLRRDEHRLALREERERVDALRQLDEVELGPGRRRIAAGLPHLEAPERAQHDEPRSRDVACRVRGVAPIGQCLCAVRRQPLRLARALHLNQASAIPYQVEEPTVLGILDAGSRLVAVSPVTREQLVEVGLRFGPLAAVVQTPLACEVDKPALDLLASHRLTPGQGQTASCSDESVTA